MIYKKTLLLAEKQLKLHHLYEKGWCIRFDRQGFLRSAVCNFDNKTITFNLDAIELNGFLGVRNIIFHEIAHALSGFKRGHGRVWLKTLKKLNREAWISDKLFI